MLWSRQFIPTVKEVPHEAEIESHRLMLRAGMIRRLGAGLYTFLPLGVRALANVTRIVREEMDRAGALETLMPAMHPREIWERTGRYEDLSEVMFSMEDRQGRPMVLGPTHEEVITDLVAREISSYRQLPVNFYQIQTKFRDEIRPRFGLMRSKEFIMKDAYSFDTDWEGVDKSYQAMYEAYQRIFERCGLKVKAVEADSGAMGGDASHEFMVLADSGEDGIVECESCSYAANLERAEGRDPADYAFEADAPEPSRLATPDQRTIQEVSGFLKIKPRRLLKTLIYLLDEEPVAVVVPGDREINEIKLLKALPGSSLALADDETVARVTGAATGFAGPVGLSIPVYLDEKLASASGCITGANETGFHLEHVCVGRDFEPTGSGDYTMARTGDGCPRCDGTLREMRGVEVGHVFKLGTKYSEKLGAHFLDDEGKQQTAIMGCYGIGVSRTLQAVIEQSHDKDGIIWPIQVAPYPVELLAITAQDPETMNVVTRLAGELEAKGIDCLVDDRDERPGVKFKDADLVGMPLRVSVGERSLKKGVVELRVRATGESTEAPLEEAVERIVEQLAAMRA